MDNFLGLLKKIRLKRIFPHLTIIIAVMMTAMLVTEVFFNSASQLLVGPYFKALLFIFCVVSIVTSILYIVQNWNEKE